MCLVLLGQAAPIGPAETMTIRTLTGSFVILRKTLHPPISQFLHCKIDVKIGSISEYYMDLKRQ